MDKYSYFSNVLNIILENKKYFKDNILASPHNLKFFMSEDLPQLICNKYGGVYEVVPVKDVSADLKKSCDYNLYLIEFEPSYITNATDCYALVVATKDDEMRLFSFERGSSLFSKGNVNFACETKEDGTHENFGIVSSTNEFLHKVVEILKN